MNEKICDACGKAMEEGYQVEVEHRVVALICFDCILSDMIRHSKAHELVSKTVQTIKG
jgi:hypothetical protein